MPNFDVSKEWVILAPKGVKGVRKCAEDLCGCVGLLRKLPGAAFAPPRIEDAAGPAPPEEAPIIILNAGDAGPQRNGFSWRAGERRIEIYGESGRGLCNGVYDFLSALGFRWPQPDGRELRGKEISPALKADMIYPLKSGGVYSPSNYSGGGPKDIPWKRFVVDAKTPYLRRAKKPDALIAWAARNKYDALVFPLESPIQAGKTAGDYALELEAGGWQLSRLLPRKLFLFHREFFRMEGGKRRKDINFCPTNPETIRIIKEEGAKFFRSAPGVKIFHLWPDRGEEKNWCTCPTCRAFTPAEQNRIAINAVADALAEINKTAFISFYEEKGEAADIPLRKNVFALETLP
ncbi:MAG: DUF4838 domain-containing protein [Treponema sp.]|jgi:hypothetical protein|nr:DUF4838 domain-containing protein [Treponema sp.]